MFFANSLQFQSSYILESHFPDCSLYLTSDFGVVGNLIISNNVFWQEFSQIYLFCDKGINKIDSFMMTKPHVNFNTMLLSKCDQPGF